MYKIKKPHKCSNHLAPVAQLFLGFEEQPLALLEKDKQVAKFGMLLQCTICKIVGVAPLDKPIPEPKEPEHKCDCAENCKCKDKDAERKETKEE